MEVDQMCNVLLLGVATLAIVLVWIVDLNAPAERARKRFRKERNKE
jgi:hypothetical protein